MTRQEFRSLCAELVSLNARLLGGTHCDFDWWRHFTHVHWPDLEGRLADAGNTPHSVKVAEWHRQFLRHTKNVSSIVQTYIVPSVSACRLPTDTDIRRLAQSIQQLLTSSAQLQDDPQFGKQDQTALVGSATVKHVLRITSDQQRVLDAVLTSLLEEPESGRSTAFGRELRYELRDLSKDARQSLINSCVPRLLRQTREDRDDTYAFTLDGILGTSHPRVIPIINAVLSVLRRKYNEPGGRRMTLLSWTDVMAELPNGTDSDFGVAWQVILTVNLGTAGGLGLGKEETGSGYKFFVPKDLEQIVECDDVWALREYRSTSYQPSQDQSTSNVSGDTRDIMSTKIFISHSGQDQSIAQSLVTSLIEAIEIPDGSLRCTSVPGYGLSPGAKFDDELLQNLKSSNIVIGLLTKASLGSGYVIMELGAAWGLEITTCPLLGPGITPADIPGPLARTHAVSTERVSNIVSLIRAVASATGMRLKEQSLTASAERFAEACHAEST